MDREGDKLRQEQEPPDHILSDEAGISEPEETLGPPLEEEQLGSASSSSDGPGEATPVPRKVSVAAYSAESDEDASTGLRRLLESEMTREDVERASERTPLLGVAVIKQPVMSGFRSSWKDIKLRAGKLTMRDVVRSCVEEPVKTLPSVILGSLLNVLDGVSYGMIL